MSVPAELLLSLKLIKLSLETFTSTQLGWSFALGVDQSCHPGPVPGVCVLPSSNVEGESFSQSAGDILSDWQTHRPGRVLIFSDFYVRYFFPLATDQGLLIVSHPAVDLLQVILESPVSEQITLGYSHADRPALKEVHALLPARTSPPVIDPNQKYLRRGGLRAVLTPAVFPGYLWGRGRTPLPLSTSPDSRG